MLNKIEAKKDHPMNLDNMSLYLEIPFKGIKGTIPAGQKISLMIKGLKNPPITNNSELKGLIEIHKYIDITNDFG